MKTRAASRSTPRDVCQHFGRAVQKRRVELGITQEQLAADAGINRTYVGDVERGARNVALRNIERITAALGLSIAAFFSRYRIQD